MNKLIDIFNPQRFIRVLLTDLLLLQARRVLFASLGLLGVGMIAYASNVNSVAPDANQQVALVVFAVLLLGGGQVFTSMIFNDMHHPLERFHYLTLPCSNLERFVSRYLITAPLFVVYAIVLFKVFEFLANLVCAWLWDVTMPLLDFGAEETQRVIASYFFSHVFVFAAAIWFRSYALIKLMATGFLFWTLCGLVSFLAIRIFYAESFISWFEMNPEGPYFDLELDFLGINEDGTLKLWQKLFVAAGVAWVLLLAYLGLKEHEVQDGL